MDRFVARLLISFGFLIFLAGAPTSEATVWFTSPELRLAASDLAAFVSSQSETPTKEEAANSKSVFTAGDWVIANQTKNRHPSVETALSPKERGFLETAGQESFVGINHGGIRFLVGGGHRGAVYAVFHIEDQWDEEGAMPLETNAQTVKAVPRFKIRIAGAGGPDPEADYGQPIPNDYDWATYARSLARYGINMTPGVIQGRPVPDNVLRPWGIRKILFVSAIPFTESKLRRWRAANPG